MTKRHTIEKLFTLAFFLLSLLILAGFIPVRLPLLAAAAESVLRNAGADSASVGAVSVTLWTGLQVREVSTYKRINDKGDAYRTDIARADISCNLFAAAAALAANRDMLKADRDVFREAYEKPIELVGEICGGAASLRPLKRIALRGADARLTSKGKPGISATGAEITLARKKGRALAGNISAKEAAVPSLAKVEGFSIKLSTNNEKLDLANGSGTVFGGKLQIDLSVDIKNSKIISGSVSLRGLDLEKYCAGTNFSPGAIAGKFDFEAKAEPNSPIALDKLKAKGRAAVANLTAADIALQKTQAVNQLSRDLRLLRFSAVKGDFRVHSGRFNFSEIAGTGNVLKFKSAGWVAFDGKLSQDLDGEFSKDFVATLPRLVRGSLERTEEEGGAFKCKITGTFHKPKVEVDKSVYDRALGGFFKNLFK
ncbi:MAG: AsmA-like C-terminal region-containing protein [Chitinispirillales bacterium]|jgi:hypothetical protein|nr:AsmA-like C-terminal region-containing protein [Chitinispirillales bacterium]